MKNERRKYRVVSLLIIVAFFIVFLIDLLFFPIFKGDVNFTEHSWELVSTSAVLTGFIFSSIGLIVAFLAIPRIETLSKDGYLDKYFESLFLSLSVFLFSMIVGIVGGFLKSANVANVLKLIQLYTFFTGCSLFILNIKMLYTIVNKARNGHNSDPDSDGNRI